jgi:hypothetical protein
MALNEEMASVQGRELRGPGTEAYNKRIGAIKGFDWNMLGIV